VEIKTPMTTEEELDDSWENLESIMIARMIFHDKMPPQDMENLGHIQQTHKECLSKRQQIQKAQEQQRDMLSWSKIRWNYFYKKLKG
jgi:hypothetical protein